MTRHQLCAWLCAPLLALAAASCGIRGRPLPPLIILPPAAADFDAVRLGDEVHLHFTIPQANADGSQPPDIRRVDLYALTTLPGPERPQPDAAEWIEDADPVFSFDVVVPAEPEAGEEPAPGAAPDDGAAGAPVYAPGQAVMVVEMLTPAIVAPAPVDPDAEEEAEEEEAAETEVSVRPLAVPLVSPPLPRVPRRTYAAVVVSGRNRRSEPVLAPPVPVQPAPEAPGTPLLTYDETTIAVEWEPPTTARLPLQRPLPAAPEETTSPDDATAPDDAAPSDDVTPPDDATSPDDVAPPADIAQAADVTPAADAAAVDDVAPADDVADPDDTAAAEAADTAPPPPLASTSLLPPQIATRYDVYDVTPPGAAQPASDTEPDAEAQAGGLPRPLNGEPLEVASYAGVPAELGGERCFVVRTVDTVDPADSLLLRSAASETVCVQLVDVFPPPAPTGLVAVGGGGAISLNWQASSGSDVSGYVVLRGRGADGELAALTSEPITANNYRDAEVESGATYVYAVQALDDAETPNRSPESERVTAQAP